ncbi:MAG: flagellar export chaperone FlgN [Phycisphaeraceae bacterium]
MTTFLPPSARVETRRTAPQQPALDAASLIKTLQQQVMLYERLEGLAVHQQRFIAAGEGESLLDLLAHRQRLIEEIQDVQRVLDADASRWPQLNESLSEYERETIVAAAQRIGELNAQIIAQDEIDRAALSDVRGRFSDELRKLKQGGAAAKAYDSASGATNPRSPLTAAKQGRFTDQQG